MSSSLLRSIEFNLKYSSLVLIISVFSRQFLLKKLTNILNNVHQLGLKKYQLISELDQMQARVELETIKRIISRFNNLYNKLHGAGFYKDHLLETKSKLVLNTLYDVESDIRIKAFSGHRSSPTDPQILDFLVTSSHDAIQEALLRMRQVPSNKDAMSKLKP